MWYGHADGLHRTEGAKCGESSIGNQILDEPSVSDTYFSPGRNSIFSKWGEMVRDVADKNSAQESQAISQSDRQHPRLMTRLYGWRRKRCHDCCRFCIQLSGLPPVVADRWQANEGVS